MFKTNLEELHSEPTIVFTLKGSKTDYAILSTIIREINNATLKRWGELRSFKTLFKWLCALNVGAETDTYINGKAKDYRYIMTQRELDDTIRVLKKAFDEIDIESVAFYPFSFFISQLEKLKSNEHSTESIAT